MANVMLFPKRALTVYKSDDANIPFPAVTVSGTGDGSAGSTLIDTTQNFVGKGIFPGDIVYNTTTGTSATVIKEPVISAPDTIELNGAIFLSVTDSYIIYQSSARNGGNNTGCSLYVGTGGSVSVVTAGGDDVVLSNVQDGTIIPLQVIKVKDSTTAKDIIAMW